MKKQRWLSMILSLIMLCSMTVTTSAAAAKVTKKVITSVVFDAINNKNQLIKVYNKSYGDKYTYNAQGLVKSYFYTYGGTEELTYDSKKNKKTSVIYYRYTTRYNYTNTYKNGLLTKQVTKMNGAYQGTTTFKYKTVSVPSTSKAKVDKQQWAIRNDDYLSTIGGKYMSYN